MQNILVIRFGSLGDLCILGWALSRLAERPGASQRRVTLVTKAAFAPLMQKMHGIDEVVGLPGGGIGDVSRLAAQLRTRSWDQILDAHNILRGHLLLGLMGRRSDRRLAKDTAARLAFMALKRSDARLSRTMLDRFEDVFGGLAAGTGPRDKFPGKPPLLALGAGHSGGPSPLGMAPGAQWATKRWPEAHFAGLLEQHLAADPRPVRIFLGPRENEWFPRGPLARTAASSERVSVIQGKSLVEVGALLAECRLLVTNDSGLLHLSEAVGTPVQALFGPTVREFGYFPLLPASRVVERPLECRPCSRNGKRSCHRGDQACLVEIAPAEAHAIMREILEDGS